MKSFRKVIDLLGTGQTLWGWFAFVFPGVGAAVTGALAHFEQEPWSIVIFLAAGVLCFLSVALTTASRWWRDNTIKGKIRLEDLVVTQIGKQKPSDETCMLNCAFIIKNHSTFDLLYMLENVTLVLQNRTGERYMSQQKTIIPSGAISSIAVATIPGIDIKAPATGNATLKISFGKNENSLSHFYEIDGIPNVGFVLNSNGVLVGTYADILFRTIKYA